MPSVWQVAFGSSTPPSDPDTDGPWRPGQIGDTADERRGRADMAGNGGQPPSPVSDLTTVVRLRSS